MFEVTCLRSGIANHERDTHIAGESAHAKDLH
jgi:hypothetical protein